MKRKINGRTAKTMGVSLSQKQKTYAEERAGKAGIPVSRYIQALIEYDRTHGILGRALTLNLEAA